MVLMLLAEGFEEIEAVYPLDVLRRCGVDVKTVGVSSEYVTGSNKITIKSNIEIDDIKLNGDIDMLIIPGGPGKVNLRKSEKAMELIRHCFKSDIPVAAICGAPEIPGEIGLLKGKKATCYPGLEKSLVGVEFVDEPVVVDGNLITSKAAGTSEAFAFAIVEHICGKEKADEIAKKMICK